MSRHSLVKTKGFFVATELARPEVSGRDRVFICCDRIFLCQYIIFLCRDRVGHNRENFCYDRGFLGRDKAGYDREEAMRARQALEAHDRVICTTREFCHDREFSIVTDWDRA